MDRRELLKVMAMALGSGVALPQSAFARMGEAFHESDLTFFRPAQREQVAMLAEAIIPETDTPGAIAAGVPGWIELIVKDCLEPEDQVIIIRGMATLMKRCASLYRMGFDKLSPEEQVKFLTAEDEQAKATKRQKEKAGEPQRNTFLEQFKELTKFCYVNSEIGGTKAFDFQLVPGKWIPDMPLEPGMKPYTM